MPARSRKRLVLIPLAVVALLAASAFGLMVVKDRTYVPSAPFAPSGDAVRDTAVVYYSRSGHSEAVAREIARTYDAPIARIDAAAYPLDFSGQAQAIADAREGRLPTITVEPIDLSGTRRLYLVAPTWLFRPAAPLWAFVEQTDLTGKRVVLVMTGNSRYEQERVDEFAAQVRERGGSFERHVFLRRGRIYWQMSREELLEATRRELASEPARAP